MHHPGMIVPRECGVTVSRRHCEERSDDAIHASASGEMDCFAALAMTRKRLFDNRSKESSECAHAGYDDLTASS
jgi:hypothetical protein